MRPNSTNRKALYDAVTAAGADMTALGVMYYSVLATRFGMTVSDWRAWDFLQRNGPMTAGEFAEFTGLTPGGATALVNRLARAGVVAREAESSDGRKVIVRARSSAGAKVSSAIRAPMLNAIRGLYAGYSDDELRAIARFMSQVAETLKVETANLQTSKKRTTRRRFPD